MEKKGTYADRTFYQKSGEKSYLIIRSSEEPELPYQINMIRYNKITGLLPVQFFIEDGEYRYFYDISCKESLAEKMKYKKYSIIEIRTVMSDLYRCVKQLEEYLLDINCLILDPEYMFSENDVLDIQLCFYQDKKETFEESLEGLFEYFMNRLNYQDEKTVLLVYGLYQKSREEHTPLNELMKQFCDIPGAALEQDMEECLKSNEEFCREEKKYCEIEPDNDMIFSNQGDPDKKICSYEKSIIYKWIPYVPDVVGAYGIARILWYVGNNHTQMPEKVFMLWMFAVAGILAGCGLISTFLSHYLEKRLEESHEKTIINEEQRTYTGQRSHNEQRSNNEQKISKENIGIDIHEDEEMLCQGNKKIIHHKGLEAEKVKENLFDEFCFQEEEETDANINLEEIYGQNPEREDVYSKAINSIPATVVMNQPELFRAFNPVLVSKNKDKFQDILLKERIMVVGKIRGIADICLEGQSISRVHARICQDKNGCSIIDLGSTNGTFVNGLRLKERQRQYLEKGDEVRFAEAVYEFLPAETENVRSHRISEVI